MSVKFRTARATSPRRMDRCGAQECETYRWLRTQQVGALSAIQAFLRHAQYWLYLRNKYQEAHELPPAPFILLTRFTPGTIPSSPSILFFPINHSPPVDSISSSLCPHILVPNTSTDLTIQHYGVLFARPSELFFEFDPRALVPQPVTYP